MYIRLSYPVSKISNEHASNFGESLGKILAMVIENPDIYIGELDFLSERQRKQIYQWNQEWPEMTTECAHDMIKRQVEQQPEAMAIVSSEGDFTYRELDELSTRLSHFLAELGVGPEVIVPLCFEKSAWAIVAMMGVMKAGGALVFLDPSQPMARLDEILTQVGAHFVITSPTTASLWGSPSTFNTVIIARTFLESLPKYPQPPSSNVRASNALYVVFTSGSTGKPKGCIVEHRNFCTGAKIHWHGSGLGPWSRVSQFASYTFDVSILEIVTALMAGACICVPSLASLSKGLASVINEYGITWSFLTPSLVRLMKPDDVPSLRTLILGGEALTKLEVETWADKVHLINGYGPSECSIAAAANPHVSVNDDPANIGHAIGGVCWIVDAIDHNRLVPVGVVGELLIQGPILARGYLGNSEKTAEAFIEDPAWVQNDDYSGITNRFYKTSDLARYNEDGSIHFIGRKDTQVKLRGQRIELGEIEHHLMAHELVNHALVLLPKSGPCIQKLVAILSINGVSLQESNAEVRDDIRRVDRNAEEVAEAAEKIKAYISALLPSYMVPALWITVEGIPLMVSGKMNRVRVSQWVNDMSEKTYLNIIGVESSSIDISLGTESERLLRRVYSEVLNMKADQIPLGRSFLSLGGDSISAMQVVARCREQGRSISVKDILRSKTVSELSLHMGHTNKPIISTPERFNTPFGLSPVQQMYFQTTSEGGSSKHYNQSFLLQLTQALTEEVLAMSIETIIKRHSILRARFSQGPDGQWTQQILEEVQVYSHLFTSHKINSVHDATPIIMSTHAAIDFRSGPIFAARLFNTNDNSQFLFLVAHHLVVDLVSWRIIMQDLEKLARGEGLAITKPLPFQIWLSLQAEYAAKHLDPDLVLPFEAPPADYGYWGMDGKSNTVSDTLEEIVSLDLKETTSLLGDQCHVALRTEPIDLLLAALIHSFSMVFSDRQVPVLFREGHGREPWTDEIDLSATVGWFTTMYPFYIADVNGQDIVDIIRQVKDTRHRVPGNGWPYFASRFLNALGIERFRDDRKAEVSFDYLGLYQQLERDDALFRLARRDDSVAYDVGAGVRRFMLIEITAEVIEGKMQYQFLYNRYMRHEEKIRHWITQCKESLKLAINRLSNISKQYTLSDFPLLPRLTYEELDDLMDRRLPQYGIKPEDLEDVYPCTPMQQGLLLSQLKLTGLYEYFHTMEIVPSRSNEYVDIRYLYDAWCQVVSRHPALRTVFVESLSPDRLYDQFVLKRIDTWIEHFECSSEDYLAVFNEQQPVTAYMGRAPHRLTICTTPTKRVFCKLELNHAIVDGASLSVILNDLTAAYDCKLSGLGLPFSDYVSHISQFDQESMLNYWREYLRDLGPCRIEFQRPKLPQTKNQWNTIKLDLDANLESMRVLCEQYGVTVSNVLQTAWGLVLRQYTGLDHVSFGYLSSGRDALVVGIEDAVGPYLTMLICRQNLEKESPLTKLLETSRDDFTRSLENQFCSLADIQHSMELSGSSLFNTVFSLQKIQNVAGRMHKDASISIDLLIKHDPTEVGELSFGTDCMCLVFDIDLLNSTILQSTLSSPTTVCPARLSITASLCLKSKHSASLTRLSMLCRVS